MNLRDAIGDESSIVTALTHPSAIIRSSYPMSRVNRDLDHILNMNVVVAAAVTIHRAHFVATAVLATVGPVWASISDEKVLRCLLIAISPPLFRIRSKSKIRRTRLKDSTKLL